LRILLVLVDLEDNAIVLQQLNKLAVLHNMTLILAWSEEEAARYLETYKYAEGNDASLIQRKEKTNFVDQATEFLAGAQGVNKTDAASLLSQFTSVKAIMAASKEELGLVPGLGQVKVKRLHDAFHKPFSSKRARERKKQKEEAEARKENSERKEENKKEEDVKNSNDKLEGQQKEEDVTETRSETEAS
jgi:DNA excision repair protein ERCC-1